jgi:predicted ChrR family anti-sigma factor
MTQPTHPDASGALRLALSNLFGPQQDFSGYDFQPFRPGVEIARLYGDGHQGPSAALLRYAAGASVPEHAHTGHEHILVLAGAQRDQRGEYGPGTCLIHGPDTQHAVASDHGCIALAIWNQPIVFT